MLPRAASFARSRRHDAPSKSALDRQPASAKLHRACAFAVDSDSQHLRMDDWKAIRATQDAQLEVVVGLVGEVGQQLRRLAEVPQPVADEVEEVVARALDACGAASRRVRRERTYRRRARRGCACAGRGGRRGSRGPRRCSRRAPATDSSPAAGRRPRAACASSSTSSLPPLRRAGTRLRGEGASSHRGSVLEGRLKDTSARAGPPPSAFELEQARAESRVEPRRARRRCWTCGPHPCARAKPREARVCEPRRDVPSGNS